MELIPNFDFCAYVRYLCNIITATLHMGLDTRKPDMLDANNKGADQPAHQRSSLISAFVFFANCKV